MLKKEKKREFEELLRSKDMEVVSAETNKRVLKIERNLFEWPIASLSQKPNFKVLEFTDTVTDPLTGKKVPRERALDGSLEYGTPIAVDNKVLMTLMYIAEKQGLYRTNKKTIRYTTFEFCKYAGWSLCKENYHKHDMSLLRLHAATIRGKYSFWDKERKEFFPLYKGFHLLQSFKLREKRVSKDHPLYGHYWDEPFNKITFGDEIMDSFHAGYIRMLDYDFFQSLTSPLSSRCFVYLDMMLYRKTEYRFNLKVLCFEHLGMGRNYDSAQLKRKLSKALNELVDKGYLASYDYENKSVLILKRKQIELHSQRKELINYFKNKAPYSSPTLPNVKEITAAESLIHDYGIEKAKYIVDYACKKAFETNFKMKYFGAVMSYKKEAMKKLDWEKERIKIMHQKAEEENAYINAVKKERAEIEEASKKYSLLPFEKQTEMRIEAKKNIKAKKCLITERGIQFEICKILSNQK